MGKRNSRRELRRLERAESMKDIQEIIKRELHPSIEDTIDSTIKSPLEKLMKGPVQ